MGDPVYASSQQKEKTVMNALQQIDDEDTMEAFSSSPPSALAAMHESEINSQVSTAKRYPRMVGRVMRLIDSYATNDEETAQQCIYALKRGGKEIIGPSVRFAEIVASAWGNSIFGARIVDEGKEFITAQGVFHDLEVNNRFSFEVPRRIIDSNGNRYNIDMIGVTGNAAMSIALRNAILKGIPKAVWGPSYNKCLSAIKGTFETIERRRTSALEAYAKLGVDESLVLGLLERTDIRDISPEDMVVMRGTLQAINDGDTTLRQVFKDVAPATKRGAKADVSGKLKDGKTAAAAAKPAEKAKPAEPEKKAEPDKATETAQDAPQPDSGSQEPPQGETRTDAPAAADSAEAEDAGQETAEETADQDEMPAEINPSLQKIIDDGDFSDEERAALLTAAEDLSLCKTPGDLNKAVKRLSSKFEAEPPVVESTFSRMVALAMRELNSGGAKKLL